MPDDLGTPVSPPPGQGEAAAAPPPGRNPDEVALDLMKFIAVTTGYGRSSGSTAGFSAKTATRSAEEYAESLIQLFERCREVMKKGK
jgi:hypothetical protein